MCWFWTNWLKLVGLTRCFPILQCTTLKNTAFGLGCMMHGYPWIWNFLHKNMLMSSMSLHRLGMSRCACAFAPLLLSLRAAQDPRDNWTCCFVAKSDRRIDPFLYTYIYIYHISCIDIMYCNLSYTIIYHISSYIRRDCVRGVLCFYRSRLPEVGCCE